ncbi:MAG: hypothetical protein AAGE52_39410 [Myxococcota bacterium]
MRLLPLALLTACAAAPNPVVSVPVDLDDDESRYWAAVLREPLRIDPPTLSELVRNSLASPTELVDARRVADADARERRYLAKELLPLALSSSMHPVLVAAAEELRHADDPLPVLEQTVASMRQRRITCRAYRGVLFGGHEGRDVGRDENAFVALEIVYFYLRGEDNAPQDPIDCGTEAPTALLRPQLVPYLAVAAGAEPAEVRASVASLLRSMYR